LFTVATEVKLEKFWSLCSRYADVLLLPSNEDQAGIVLELKELNTMTVLKKGEQDFDDAIAECATLLEGKTDEDLLDLTVLAFLGSKKKVAPIRDHLNAAKSQLKDYLDLISKQKPHSAGYRGWVFIRVGTTRIIASEVK